MSLFFSRRDANLVHKVNKELHDKVSSIEIGYYQISPSEMQTNSYGETKKKTFAAPVIVTCFVLKNPESWNTNDNVYDMTEVVGFAIIRDTLIENNLVPTAGDIIEWDENFYEVDAIEQDIYWGAKNPDTNLTQDQHGFNTAVVIRAHKTRRENWDIKDTYSGGLNK